MVRRFCPMYGPEDRLPFRAVHVSRDLMQIRELWLVPLRRLRRVKHRLRRRWRWRHYL
jgi:hypothetical protein